MLLVPEIWTQILNFLIPIYSLPTKMLEDSLFKSVFPHKRTLYNKLVFVIFRPVFTAVHKKAATIFKIVKQNSEQFTDWIELFRSVRTVHGGGDLLMHQFTKQKDEIMENLIENLYTYFQVVLVNKQLYTHLRYQQHQFWIHVFALMKNVYCSSSNVFSKIIANREADYYKLAKKELLNWIYTSLKKEFKQLASIALEDVSKLVQEEDMTSNFLLDNSQLPASFLSFESFAKELVFQLGYSKERVYITFLDALAELKHLDHFAPFCINRIIRQPDLQDIYPTLMEALFNYAYHPNRMSQNPMFFIYVELLDTVDDTKFDWKTLFHLYDNTSCIGNFLWYKDWDALIAVLKLLKRHFTQEKEFYSGNYLATFLTGFVASCHELDSSRLNRIIWILETFLLVIPNCKYELQFLIFNFWHLDVLQCGNVYRELGPHDVKLFKDYSSIILQKANNFIKITKLVVERFQVSLKNGMNGNTVLHFLINDDINFISIYKYNKIHKANSKWMLELKQLLLVKNEQNNTPLTSYAEHKLKDLDRCEYGLSIRLKKVLQRMKQVKKWCNIEPVIDWDTVYKESDLEGWVRSFTCSKKLSDKAKAGVVQQIHNIC